jgi:glucose-1-phosphate adenylyltransferase
LQEEHIRDVLILAGDQLYRMDFRRMIEVHRRTAADITVAVLPVAEEQTSAFGIVRLDADGRVIDFVEKPTKPEQLDRLRTDPAWMERLGLKPQGRCYLASMGIYLFRKPVLFEVLSVRPPYTDFGKDVFPNSYRKYRVQAFLFDGYWEDLGTIKAYHQATLALCGPNPPFEFHHPDGVIYTRMRFLPASRVLGASVENCLISDGCVVQEGAKLVHSVIGIRTQIGRNVYLRDSIVIGADRYETPEEKRRNEQLGIPNMGIGEGSVIERAIIDKDCRLGRHVRIVNERGLQDYEGPNYVIRDGIVVVPKGVIIPDNTVI